MMGRLSPEAVVSDHQLLDADDIVPGDIRLFHVNELAARQLVAECPEVHFVTWPDASLGLVYLSKFDVPYMAEMRALNLQSAYADARDTLESIHLQLFAMIDVSTSD